MNWGTDSLLNHSEGIWNHIKAFKSWLWSTDILMVQCVVEVSCWGMQEIQQKICQKFKKTCPGWNTTGDQ
jgi:hypothetical protein